MCCIFAFICSKVQRQPKPKSRWIQIYRRICQWTTLVARLVAGELRRFNTTGVTHAHHSCLFPAIAILQRAQNHPSPLCYVPPSSLSSPLLSLIFYLSLPCFTLFCFLSALFVSNASSCILPTCLSPFPPFPLPDSWLVWWHQAVCIFSAATDGAMAACHRPECSLSQLSDRSPGPKWILSTLGEGGEEGAAFPFPLSPSHHIEVLIVSSAVDGENEIYTTRKKWQNETLTAAVSAPSWEPSPNLWSSGGEIADHTSTGKKKEKDLSQKQIKHSSYQYILPDYQWYVVK